MKLRNGISLAILLNTCLLLAGCGGGGSDNSGGGGGDGGGGGGGANEKPTADIMFPPVDSIFTGDVLVVRGTASDDGAVNSVHVNGVAATTTNGFADWIAEVPLEFGDNELVVEVEDDENENVATADSRNVKRTLLPIVAPTGIKTHADTNRAIVLDSTMRTIFGVDLDSGERTLLSSDAVGDGDQRINGLNLDINHDGTIAHLVADEALLEVDLVTGDRTIISSASIGTGPEFTVVRDVAVDWASKKTYLSADPVSGNTSRIIAVDHETGDREIIASDAHGSGPAISFAPAIEWDASSNRLIIATNAAELIWIDPVTGVRTSFYFDGPHGHLIRSFDIALDLENDRIFVLDYATWQVFRVDVTTGYAEMISGADTGSGPEIGISNAIAYDQKNDHVLVTDSQYQIISIDNADLTRTQFSSSEDVRIGSSSALPNQGPVVLDSESRKAYVFDTATRRMTTVNLETAKRDVSAAALAMQLDAMSLDSVNGRLLAFNTLDLLEVDPANGVGTVLHTVETNPVLTSYPMRAMYLDQPGNRLLFSQFNDRSIRHVSLDDFAEGTETSTSYTTGQVGTGPELDHPTVLAIDSQRNRIIYAEASPTRLGAADIATGDRTLLFGPDDQDEPHLTGINGLQIDASGNNVYVLDAGVVVSVNLDTHAREVVTGPSVGSHAPFGYARGLTVDTELGLAWTIMVDAVIAIDLVGGDHVIIAR